MGIPISKRLIVNSLYKVLTYNALPSNIHTSTTQTEIEIMNAQEARDIFNNKGGYFLYEVLREDFDKMTDKLSEFAEDVENDKKVMSESYITYLEYDEKQESFFAKINGALIRFNESGFACVKESNA